MDNTSLILQNVTRQDLIEILEGVISEKIQELKPKPKEETEYLTRKEVKELLRISYPTLHELVNSGKLKAYRIGGRVLFIKSEVESSLETIQTLKYKRS